MYQEIKVRVKGVSPLMLHNSRLANPLDPVTKEIKRISGKRAKTEADLELLANLEWLGGLYTTESGTFKVNGNGLEIEGFGQPCLPGEVIEGAMQVAARKHKLGKSFSAGLLCDGLWPIEYTGAKSVKALSKDDSFKAKLWLEAFAGIIVLEPEAFVEKRPETKRLRRARLVA